MPRWYTEQTKNLFTAILALTTQEEAKKFFRDLLTEAEIAEFSRRWEAANMLERKESYTKIVKKTSLSSTTVARVSRWLNRGMGGYRLMLDRLNNQQNHHHHPSDAFGKRLV